MTPIDKNTVEQIQTDNLKYFYDLKPNEAVTWSSSFVKKPVTNVYNNDGLNSTKNYTIGKLPGTYRIIALGDSYTYGHWVATKDNWVELLENKLNEKPLCKNINKFEVINFGVHGYDPEYEVEKYKRSGQKYNPDLIIWMLVDFERINELRYPWYYECLKKHPDGEFTYCSYNNNIEALVKEVGDDYINSWQRNIIIGFQNIYKKHIFFVDYYGTHQKVVKDIPNSTDFAGIFNKDYLLKNYAKEKVQFIDNHPNELGHKLIADILFDQLFRTNQIPCDPIK